MGGIASNPQVQNAINTLPQQPGQQPGEAQVYPPFGGGLNKPFVNAPYQPGQMPQKPGQPFQMPLPEGYQSPYATYGFDPALQSYLDQQNYRSATDAGTSFQYDPATQTFTGGTMSGKYNPIPLNVMQQAAGGNYGSLSPYFQSRFPQPTSPVPTVKPGMPTQTQPFTPRPYPGQGNDIRRGPMSPQMPQRPMPQFDPRRSGLGALSGLNGVPGNQNPLYFGPGYK